MQLQDIQIITKIKASTCGELNLTHSSYPPSCSLNPPAPAGQLKELEEQKKKKIPHGLK